ncbi:MAG TPA: hypothetical protein VGZ47_18990, partial [Gemmataceae bacterium]|nr:hypothetical protein [Gemmataceae bacterium]
MSFVKKIRRGERPFWAALKRCAKAVLCFHLPVVGPTRFLFGLLYCLHVFGRESLIWGLRFFWYEPLFRSQCESVGPRFRMEKLPYLNGKGRIVIGSEVRLSGKCSIAFSSRVDGDPEFSI